MISAALSVVALPTTAATPDERFLKLDAVDRPLALTKLLSETFAAPMTRLIEEILANPDAVVALAPKLKPPTAAQRYSHPVMTDRLGFSGVLTFDDENQVASTPHNLVVTRRWSRAVRAIELYSRGFRTEIEATPSWRGSVALLSAHSYGKLDFGLTLHYATKGTEQAITQLTAQPVGSLTADQTLRQILAPRGDRQSLAVLYALRLIPEILSRTGRHGFIPNAIVERTGRLDFSPSLNDALDRLQMIFAVRPHKNFEMGRGCPLGHRLPGQATSSLQTYLDAALVIYDRLHAETCEGLFAEGAVAP